MKRELDIVVLSDTHLGTYGCHARELLEYLGSIKPKTLILNGDFIDIWQFRKRYFPKEHLQVIQRILKMADKGTKVYYITGNHDDSLRRYSEFSAGNIHLCDKLSLELNGKKYWFFHGDIFDLFIKYSPWMAKIGGKGYDWLIFFNRLINQARHRMGMSRMSFAKKVKNRVKEAVKFIGDFEHTAINLAGEKGYDYVVCGHIHRPQLREVIAENGRPVTYLNSGDWVESLTALEYRFGTWALYEHDELDYRTVSKRLQVASSNAPVADEADAEKHLQPSVLLEQIIGEMVK